MKRFAGLMLLFSLGLVAAGCGGPVDYSSADGKFKVTFPGAPKEQTQEAKGIKIKMFVVDKGDRAYFVAYSDLPAGTFVDFDGALNGAVAGKGSIKERSKITLKDIPGIEGEAELTNPAGAKMKIRVYAAGNRMYQVMAIAKGDGLKSEETAKFFNSFELLP